MHENILNVSLNALGEKVKFSASSEGNPEIILDYAPPTGTGRGYTSMELLLISLLSCLSATVLSLLRARMRRTVNALSGGAKGWLKDTHPKAFSRIEITLAVASPDATEEEVKRAIAAAEEKVCPVWAMIKGNVDVVTKFTIDGAPHPGGEACPTTFRTN